MCSRNVGLKLVLTAAINYPRAGLAATLNHIEHYCLILAAGTSNLSLTLLAVHVPRLSADERSRLLRLHRRASHLHAHPAGLRGCV